jgi:hypothetical protein
MRHLVLLFVAVLVTGCAGTMQGMVRGTGQIVQINYDQALAHDNLKVVLPDGETFIGKAVQVGNSLSIGSAFGSGTAITSRGQVVSGMASGFGVVSTFSGNVQAVMFGNRGRSMQCRLKYADSSGFTSAGGVGVCETSDGKVIDVMW